MRRLPRRERVRIHPYLEPAVADQLKAYSAATGIASSALVQSALAQYLDRTGDTALLLRRFDRLGRAVERIDRDLGFLAEGFGVFVRLWLAYTPRIPDDGKEFARRSSEARFAQFIEHVVERFTGGPRFLDDLPREVLADDGELRDIAAHGPSREAGAASPQGDDEE